MTILSTNITTAPSRRARAWAWVTRLIEAQAASCSRRAQILALEAMSDAELAQLGLRRDDIPWHVFRDRFYC